MKLAYSSLVVFAALAAQGCVPIAPLEHIDGAGSAWDSPLNGDLRLAIADFQAKARKENLPFQIKWAGVRGSSYDVVRGPSGQPLGKAVDVVFVFLDTSTNKCHLNFVNQSGPQYYGRLVRQNEGGSAYGPPEMAVHFNQLADESYQHARTREVLCSAVDEVKGGVHIADEGATPPPTQTTAGQVEGPSSTDPVSGAYDPEQTLASLAPGVAPACHDYARAACTNPRLPAGTNRQSFCEALVAQTNAKAGSPKAQATCKTMLKSLVPSGRSLPKS